MNSSKKNIDHKSSKEELQKKVFSLFCNLEKLRNSITIVIVIILIMIITTIIIIVIIMIIITIILIIKVVTIFLWGGKNKKGTRTSGDNY